MRSREWARRHPRRRAARRRSGARLRRQEALLWNANELGEIALEAFARARGARVVREVRIIDAVHAGDTQWPGSAWRRRECRYINGSNDSGSENLILQHVAGFQLFIGNETALRSVRDGAELASAPDPHVARLVRPAGVEKRDVGLNRRDKQNGV